MKTHLYYVLCEIKSIVFFLGIIVFFGKQLKKGPLKNVQGLKIVEGMLMKFNKVVVPETLTKNIVLECHGQYHSGVDNSTLVFDDKEKILVARYRQTCRKVFRQCRTISQWKAMETPRERLQLP